ncbi:hypothetical protein VOLCADRAFT_90132 [Volvox carteri f. nagariensis]|uniref:MalT-like TPR region domain-containing protein n=1 Tax=Volvox carteri f. nagariensis TaxID=3068 RepID=D8TTK0_VOLCA|nr:uncharacterized protein VOLCADRAFT_90132 [Volvox carteri f. nagariensis]EFJ49211.1 hypothetical protein VOLCADRAFT_90132 [Volvox carteri f. nagariensis]|eukprot:XP_002949659.1 hypothetical protein VOLCADRAFT_90132 [Volvox carteri f. nagariensis]
MAVDVLMSGLSYTSPQTDPVGSARLHLAIAQLEANRNHWVKAQEQAASSTRLAAAAAPSSEAARDLTLAAGSLATRASLILGHDQDAQSLATECERALRAAGPSTSPSGTQQPPGGFEGPGGAPFSRNTAHIRSLGLRAIAMQGSAASSADAAAAGDLLAAALGPDPAAATRADQRLADAAHAVGLLRALQGRREESEAALTAAADAAGVAPAEGASASPSSWAQQQHNREVAADALTGQAQILMKAREWGEAEERMGEALKAAEAAHGDKSPSLAPLLTLLGYTYSRSARVTFAEGLYRGEAARWEGCARQFWAASGELAGCEIEAVLGGEGHLKGEGPEGSGVLISTQFRRAWLCLPLP